MKNCNSCWFNHQVTSPECIGYCVCECHTTESWNPQSDKVWVVLPKGKKKKMLEDNQIEYELRLIRKTISSTINQCLKVLSQFQVIEYYGSDKKNHNVGREIEKILTDLRKELLK